MFSRSDNRRSGLARFWLALAASLVVLSGAVLVLPHDPYVRYQSLNDTIYNRAQWIYERIHFDDTEVDVVFIGSSRTGRGVRPVMLEASLAARGYDSKVVNFSMPSSGFDIRQAILEDLFAEKSPELLVFSVVEAFPRDGHDAFIEIADAADVLGSPPITNRNLPGNLLRLPIRQVNLTMASLLPDAYGVTRTFDPETYAGSTVDRVVEDDPALLLTEAHAEKLAQQAAQRYRLIRPPILPAQLSWIEFGVSQSYIREIVEMAEARGTKVAFLFLPFYTGYGAPIEEAWLSDYGPVWKATFLKDDPTFYIDSGHVADTPEVLNMVNDWLTDLVAEQLSAD